MSANLEQIYQDFEDSIKFLSPKEIELDKQKESFINLKNHHPFEKTKKIPIPFKKKSAPHSLSKSESSEKDSLNKIIDNLYSSEYSSFPSHLQSESSSVLENNSLDKNSLEKEQKEISKVKINENKINTTIQPINNIHSKESLEPKNENILDNKTNSDILPQNPTSEKTQKLEIVQNISSNEIPFQLNADKNNINFDLKIMPKKDSNLKVSSPLEIFPNKKFGQHQSFSFFESYSREIIFQIFNYHPMYYFKYELKRDDIFKMMNKDYNKEKHNPKEEENKRGQGKEKENIAVEENQNQNKEEGEKQIAEKKANKREKGKENKNIEEEEKKLGEKGKKKSNISKEEKKVNKNIGVEDIKQEGKGNENKSIAYQGEKQEEEGKENKIIEIEDKKQGKEKENNQEENPKQNKQRQKKEKINEIHSENCEQSKKKQKKAISGDIDFLIPNVTPDELKNVLDDRELAPFIFYANINREEQTDIIGEIKENFSAGKDNISQLEKYINIIKLCKKSDKISERFGVVKSNQKILLYVFDNNYKDYLRNMLFYGFHSKQFLERNESQSAKKIYELYKKTYKIDQKENVEEYKNKKKEDFVQILNDNKIGYIFIFIQDLLTINSLLVNRTKKSTEINLIKEINDLKDQFDKKFKILESQILSLKEENEKLKNQ